MKIKADQDLRTGVFVTLGLAFAMVAILVLGGSENTFSRKVSYFSHFPNANGLLPGAKVVLSGIPVGVVKEVKYDPKSQNVSVTFSIEKVKAEYIREGSAVEIMTQGVLGDKFVSIQPGGGAGILPEGSELPHQAGQDLTALLTKSDQLLIHLTESTASLERILKTLEKGNRLDKMTENMAKFSSELEGTHLKKTLQNLASITEKINGGSGTIGALVNDPGLYEDARSLVGGANRNRIIRNLVRKSAKDSDSEKK
jgi:phospholipid/cholesterol/gamma-HCH transport system substrate-binding protein